MSDQEKEFMKSCETFKDYKNIEEYKADIRRWLVLCPWRYREEEADKTIEHYADCVLEAYEGRVPAADIAVDIGYTCG